jgi:hypothetical protein
MRVVWISALCLLVGSAFNPVRADPYPWCAYYSVGDAAYNCYFLTLQQCQKTIAGIGGFCRPNLFYDGRPQGSAAAAVRPSR